MRVALKLPDGTDKLLQLYNPDRKSLRHLLGQRVEVIESCLIDGEPVDDWQDMPLTNHAAAELFVKAPETGVEEALIGALIAAAISTAVSVAVWGITALLASSKTGEGSGTPEEHFGVAGLTNTVALGTPKFMVYGTRRVFGHIISTSVDVADDGKSMTFGALYFMGVGQIQHLRDVEINNVPIELFPGTGWDWRQGGPVEAVMAGFETVSQVYADGRQIPFAPANIVYAGKGVTFDSVRLVFQSPFLFNTGQGGKRNSAVHTINVRYKKSSDSTWTDAQGSPFRWDGNSASLIFHRVNGTLPEKNQWDFQVSLASTSNDNQTPPILFNVQETESSTRAYEGNALLGVRGVGSAQITSFDSLKVSALIDGRRVKIFTGTGYVFAWTNLRQWIVRDLLTDPVYGMGYKIHEDQIDDLSFLEASSYYLGQVPNQSGGFEQRDSCDLILNDRRLDWDWIRQIANEGQAIIIPSQGKFKWVIDQNKTPNLLYAMPGNIVPGSLNASFGTEGSPKNTVITEWPDRTRSDNLNAVTVVAPDIGTEDTRDEQVALRTITRESQAIRYSRYRLNKQRLVKRHFSWTSPATAQVSEPLDVDLLSFETRNNRFGFSGKLWPDASLTRLQLDRLVTIVAGRTYEVIVRHVSVGQANIVERRLVSTGAGTWATIDLQAPLTRAVREGDIWSLGWLNVEVKPVLIESVTFADDLSVQVTASEFIASIYDNPPLPPPTGPVPRSPEGTLPLPLLAASVIEEITIEKDGSVAPFLRFEVVPGMPTRAGTVVAVTSLTVTLGTHEPAVNDYFIGARLKIIRGPGSGENKRIIAYVGAQRRITVESGFTTTIIPGSSSYQIDFERFSDFEGFDVEADDQTGVFFQVASTDGTLMMLPERGGVVANNYRFTPYSTQQVRNLNARWIKQITQFGDTIPPAAPSGLTAIGTFKMIILNWTPPADGDLDVIEVFRAPINNRAAASSIASTRATGWPDGNLPDNTTFFYWVRAFDTSGNPSPFHPLDPLGGVQARTAGIDFGDIDQVPPATPTGLVVETGTVIQPDGTIVAFVKADCNPNTENDLFGYQFFLRYVVSGFIDTRSVTTPHAIWLPVPGGLVVGVKVLATDRFGNPSGFTGELFVTTPADTGRPSAPTGLQVLGSYKLNALLWTPPVDLDYEHAEVWRAPANNRTLAIKRGDGFFSFTDSSLPSGVTFWYWLRSKDTSNNFSVGTADAPDLGSSVGWHPASVTGGVPGSTIRIPGDDLEDRDISPSKLIGDMRSLAANEGFEAGDKGWLKGPNWSIVAAPGVCRSGAWLGVKNPGTDNIVNEHLVSTHPGDQFYLSAFFLSGANPQSAAILGLAWLDGANQVFAVSTVPQLPAPTAAGSYHEASGIVVCPNGASSCQLFLQINNHVSGQWLVDDVLWLTAVGANLIAANIVSAQHLRTDTAVITTAAQIANATITNAHIQTLQADKITAGIFNATYTIGVGQNFVIDGAQRAMGIFDLNGVVRVLMGRLGGNASDWGIRIFSPTGALMFDLSGIPESGLQNGAVTAQKIRVGSIDSSHLRTDTLVVTGTAQIANLIVGTSKLTDHAVSQVFTSNIASGTFSLSEVQFCGVGIDFIQSNFVILHAEFSYKLASGFEGRTTPHLIARLLRSGSGAEITRRDYFPLASEAVNEDFSFYDTNAPVGAGYILTFAAFDPFPQAPSTQITVNPAKLTAVQIKK